MKERIKGLIDVDWRKIKALQPDDVKINTNINALKKSLKKHGFSIPFAVWKDGSTIYTIDGHTRKRALEELKHEGEEVPDKLKAFEIDAKDRKEAVQILVEVFNQKHNAFDNEVLINWLEVENVEVKDLEAVNLSSPIIEKSEAQEDDFEIPDEIKTDIKLGDLFEIGEHRLLCGDSTDSDAVAKLMNGEKADMVFTDPPYGMKLDTDYSGMSGGDRKGKKYDKVIGDNEDFKPELIHTIFACFDYCEEIFIWGVDYYFDLIPNFKIGSLIVWDKTLQTNGDADYNSEFELCWSKTPHKKEVLHFNWFRYFGLSSQDIKTREHPTQKPLQVITPFIEKYSQNIIADLFLGSGSTMVASHQLKRKCYGMELDCKYVEVIVTRMIKLDKTLIIKRNGIEETQKWLNKIA